MSVHRFDSLAEIAPLLRGDRPCYVRHSKGTELDVESYSFDYESGLRMPGLSANPMNPESWWSRPWEDWVARQICQYRHLRDGVEVRSWLLSGDCIARGPDCEPLLINITVFGWLSETVINEAQRRYDANFHPQ